MDVIARKEGNRKGGIFLLPVNVTNVNAGNCHLPSSEGRVAG